MIIVGGVYREVCREPEIDQVFGSGLRAALAVSQASPGLKLVTLGDEESAGFIQRFADSFGFGVDIGHRDYSIEFQYDTPLSHPVLKNPNTFQGYRILIWRRRWRMCQKTVFCGEKQYSFDTIAASLTLNCA